jgi:rsbT co-antagonist protein RsbR
MAKGNETAKLLAEKKDEILEAWFKEQGAAESLREDLMSRDDLLVQADNLLDALCKAASSGNLKDVDTPQYEDMRNVLTDISKRRAKLGFSPSETATFVFSLKPAIFAFLSRRYQDQPEVLARETRVVSNLLDCLGLLMFEGFVKEREDIIVKQQQELLELSTPVIEIWNGILVLPIIGTLDSARAKIVMENLLQGLVNRAASVAILDISGVPAVDTAVAQHLLKTISAAHLMGAECIVSGIRPGIAQTIVHLGIDLESVNTKANLSAALQQAFDLVKLQVLTKGQKTKEV